MCPSLQRAAVAACVWVEVLAAPETGQWTCLFSLAPDGRWLVFLSNMQGTPHVYAVEIGR